MANFAERIRALRKEKGLSQEEVGSVIGLKKYAVYSYEKGRACPDTVSYTHLERRDCWTVPGCCSSL